MEQFGTTAHKIVHGDALDVLKELPDHSIDLIFADPPYNIGKQFGAFRDSWESDDAYAAWTQCWLDLCIAKLSPTGSLYVMASTQSMPYLDLHLRSRMAVLSRIAWHYDSSGVQAKQYYGSLYEPILHAVMDRKRYTFNADAIRVEAKTGAKRKLIDYRKDVPTPYSTTKVPGNVWYFPRVRYRMSEYEEHPSQKPEALLERIILASSNPGDLVLDPFSGTFTTSAVAQRLDRRSIGIEAERDYVAIGLRRLSLASELDGASLEAPAKSHQRRKRAVPEPQLGFPELVDAGR
jgi:adenine-specific DNA-methyltransferase